MQSEAAEYLVRMKEQKKQEAEKAEAPKKESLLKKMCSAISDYETRQYQRFLKTRGAQ